MQSFFDKHENNSNKEKYHKIPEFVSTVWKLKNPTIIISIIAGVTNFKNWKNGKLEDEFKRGILKVFLL